MQTRLQRLQKQLRRRNLDAILLTHLPHVRYITGFSGTAGTLFVTPKKAWFVTDGRYEAQATEELPKGVELLIDRAHITKLKESGAITSGMSIGFQAEYVSVASHEGMKKALKRGVKLVPGGTMIRELTMPKTEEEIGHVRKAANIAAKVYKDVLGFVKPGMRENEVAAEISYLGRKYGAEGDAFEIIVASGPRSAMPHGRASSKKLKKGEMVTLDFGFVWNGFNSDMTRTFALGEPGDEARKIYDIVLRAERAGVAAARAGMKARDLDAVCRTIIDDAGYKEEFSHTTGHGLGIEVHEFPAVSPRAGDDVLVEGTIVTIEPGIYVQGKCGVRIEDDVVLRKDGCDELTSAPRKLIIV